MTQYIMNNSSQNHNILNLKINQQIYFQDKISPNNIKDLRRLVLDKKARNTDSSLNLSNNSDQFSDETKQLSFSFDSECKKINNSSPSNFQVRLQQKQELIKKMISSNEQINLDNKIHNDILLEVMKKAIRNKEEIILVQHYLKSLSILQMDQQNLDQQEIVELSQKLYPYVSYSFFKKGQTIYNSSNLQIQRKIEKINQLFLINIIGEFSFNFYVILKGQVDQYNDIDQTETSSELNLIVKESEYMNIPNKEIERVYREGQSFGDIEIITNQTRSSTMVCLEDSHLIAISKEGFDQVFVKYKRYQISEKLNFFKQYSFFQNIPDSRLLNFINSGEKIHFKNKQLIYQEGDQIDFLYFITSGEVNISQICENRRVNVQIQTKKSYFGFDEIINNMKTRSIKVMSNSNNLIVTAFQIKKFIQFLINFKQYDQFASDCSMKMNLRKDLAEQIINTQNIIYPQVDLPQQSITNENERDFSKNAIIRIRQRQKTQTELPNLYQQQINQFQPVDQLEQIVNAREEIFNTLDRQKKVQQYRNNKKFQSFDQKNTAITEYSQDSHLTQDKKALNNIFESQKELLFDQSYYMSQDIRQRNKSLLDLQYQIENSSAENMKRKQRQSFLDSQDNSSSRNSIDMKIQTLQKLKDDTSLSKFHNKILKKIVQNKINEVNLGTRTKKNSLDDIGKINSLKYIKKASQEELNIESSLNNVQYETTQNISTLKTFETTQKKELPLQNQTQYTKTIKEQVIRRMNRVKTNTVQKFFDSPSSKSNKEGQINNFQVLSLSQPQQLPKIVITDNSQEKNNTSLKNNNTPKNESELNSFSDHVQQNTKAHSKLLKISRYQSNRQSRSQTNFQIYSKRQDGDNNTTPKNTQSYLKINTQQQGYLNTTFNIPKTIIFKQIQHSQQFSKDQ